MMHPHFYHWHTRAELQPPTDILEPRWKAAARFAEKPSPDDVCSLLRLALFGAAEPEFAIRFSEELVKNEPTFPPEGNAELLRIMATAALYSKMETESVEADAVALGLLAAEFQPDRIQPVCKELALRAADYLETESERMRPTPQVEGEYQALKKAVNAEDWEDNTSAVLLLGKAVVELGETMGRISEENQFLWWLLGRRSSFLNTRREQITPKEYALVAAAEAAQRVVLLPPPASVEALIGEALSHCSKASNSAVLLADFIDAANIETLKSLVAAVSSRELCPLTSLLGVRSAGGKINAASFEMLKISEKLKISPTEIANQYFHELIFLRALAQLG